MLRQTLLASAVLSSFTLADLALAAEMTPMKPGVYTQKVVAHNGFMEVEVKLSADRIEAVKIVKSDETPYIVDEPMKQVISKVLKDQTLRVDTVSGATRSTGALLRAIGEAVEAAGGVSSEWTPDPVVIDPAKLPLADAPKADVVVIGAGASGLAAAAAAAEAGAKVVVLEKAAPSRFRTASLPLPARTSRRPPAPRLIPPVLPSSGSRIRSAPCEAASRAIPTRRALKRS